MPFGVGLLQHQHAAHVRMADDRDSRCRLVGHLRHVGRLDPLLGVLEGIQIAGRQRRHRLGADQHPGVLDDVEHLPDALVDTADEVADARLVGAERQLAGRRRLDAHLVFDLGAGDAVALAERAVVVHEVLGDDEHREALGARLRRPRGEPARGE